MSLMCPAIKNPRRDPHWKVNWSSESFPPTLLTPVLLWSIFPPGSGCREGTNHRHRPTWDWKGRVGTWGLTWMSPKTKDPEIPAVPMLPEDSRKKFWIECVVDTELVGSGFNHAKSDHRGIAERWSRTLLLPSGDLCSPWRHQVLQGSSNTKGRKQTLRTAPCSSLRVWACVGEGSSADRQAGASGSAKRIACRQRLNIHGCQQWIPER